MDNVREISGQLNRKWYGRTKQIQNLLECLIPDPCGKKCLNVYGPAGTAKTGLLRDVLQSLNFCVARLGSLEVDCSQPQLWAHIINSWRREIDEAEKKVQDDQEAILAMEELRKHTWKPFCILIDPIDSNVDAAWISAILHFWKRSSVSFTVIMVSLVPWLSVFGNACPPEPRPHPIHFRKYSQEEIETVLCRQRPDHIPKQLYVTMVRSFVRPQYHASVLLTDAQTLMADLIEEAVLANVPLTETAAIMEHLQSVRKRISEGCFYEDFPGLSAGICASTTETARNTVIESRESMTCTDSALDMARLTKLLVLAAYVASNNKPSADSKNFSAGPPQKRRRDAMASDRQAISAQKQMESEGQVFGTERWIQIFFKLVQRDQDLSHDADLDKRALAEDMQSVTVLNQIKQLASTRFVNQVVTNKDAIEGVSFTSSIPCELAESIAKRVRVNLQALLSFV